jgi:ABC-type Fe3+/spermidine/putrescine transport system ATPase subunit
MNFLEARVLAREGGTATVSVGEYTCRAENPSGLEGAVTMAVRPEDLVLGAREGLPGRVEVRNFLGNLVEYKIRLDRGEILRAQTAPALFYEEGAAVLVGIGRAILFDREETAGERGSR